MVTLLEELLERSRKRCRAAIYKHTWRHWKQFKKFLNLRSVKSKTANSWPLLAFLEAKRGEGVCSWTAMNYLSSIRVLIKRREWHMDYPFSNQVHTWSTGLDKAAPVLRDLASSLTSPRKGWIKYLQRLCSPSPVIVCCNSGYAFPRYHSRL